ncbi:MAG: hypothetical protein JNK05_17670 [Myxococcales bacterium]|nr:hypothetical protein [Myxococcales bacterium]
MNANNLVQRVVLTSAALGVLSAALMGFYYGWMSALSSGVGTVLAVANFALLAKLAVTMLDENNPGRKRAGVFLGIKFIALVTIVGVLVINNIVRGGAFMAGVSAVVAAITLVGLFNGTSTDPTDPPKQGDSSSAN